MALPRWMLPKPWAPSTPWRNWRNCSADGVSGQVRCARGPGLAALVDPDLDPPIPDPSFILAIGRHRHFGAKTANVPQYHAAFHQFAAHRHGPQLRQQVGACRIELGIAEPDQRYPAIGLFVLLHIVEDP